VNGRAGDAEEPITATAMRLATNSPERIANGIANSGRENSAMASAAAWSNPKSGVAGAGRLTKCIPGRSAQRFQQVAPEHRDHRAK
jgi:hypothetical protein